MPYGSKIKWAIKAIGFFWCMGIPFIGLSGQSFREVLEAGQLISVEWTQQRLLKETPTSSYQDKRLPFELEAGEAEVSVNLTLRLKNGEVTANIDHIRYVRMPEEAGQLSSSDTPPSPQIPTIINTRFQDGYFHPLLFCFEALRNAPFTVACKEEGYQTFFDVYRDQLTQSDAAARLIEQQRLAVENTSLPIALSATSFTDFFCLLLQETVPQQEYPVLLQSRRSQNLVTADYIAVDHPAKMCVIEGTILSPATEYVRIQHYLEGDWLKYWQDSVLTLDSQGRFYCAFPLEHARIIGLYHGYQVMKFYLEPGDTIQLTTNANAFYRSMSLGGRGQVENRFLLDFFHEMRGDTVLQRYDADLLRRDHSTYFQKIQDKGARELRFLAERQHMLRPEFTAIMRHKLRLEHANTQWEAAARFMEGKQVVLSSETLFHLQEMAKLLYDLPRGKGFDFSVEAFLTFQYQLLRQGHYSSYMGWREELALASLLPGKETYVRHAVMQLFRKYAELGALTESGQGELAALIELTRDTLLVKEMRVFEEGGKRLSEGVGFRTLLKGQLAPPWKFLSSEGVEVSSEDFLGKKLLLHIGRVENLDMAVEDIQYLNASAEELPTVVHLISAPDEESFRLGTRGKKGNFVFVIPEEMEAFKENYFIANRSNHYFLIGKEGKVLANHYDLGTARKIRDTLGEISKSTDWTAEQKLIFWQGLGLGALLLVVLSALLFWRRRVAEKREERKRQLLEVELRGIRSQMNPHFLFNAMSAIQNLIRKKEQEKADIYLGEFAGLMRRTLRNTAEAYIPLTDEIETLRQYCSLESLRHPFSYTFEVDDSIDIYNTYVPGMILQPIVENAILHGLSPQTGAKSLVVQVLPGEKGLLCTVSDNGIGVIAAQQQRQDDSHQSLGMKLIRQRLALMGLRANEHFTIADRSTLTPGTQGTIVSLTIPVEK